MSDQIKPQQPIMFGGVKLNANDIESKKVVKENGATRFVVNFKNGSTVKYPNQAPKNNSSISFGDDFKEQVDINRMYGAEFTGSDNHNTRDYDFIRANGCSNCIFDVSNDGSLDRVVLYNAGRFKSKNNEIKMDEQDITNVTYKDWLQIEGEGTHVEGNE